MLPEKFQEIVKTFLLSSNRSLFVDERELHGIVVKAVCIASVRLEFEFQRYQNFEKHLATRTWGVITRVANRVKEKAADRKKLVPQLLSQCRGPEKMKALTLPFPKLKIEYGATYLTVTCTDTLKDFVRTQ